VVSFTSNTSAMQRVSVTSALQLNSASATTTAFYQVFCQQVVNTKQYNSWF